MLGVLDSVVIVISLALVVGAVLRTAGKKQTDVEYFLAGRDLRWPFIGMSLLASNISAEHVVGLAGDGDRVGMVTGGFEWMWRARPPSPIASPASSVPGCAFRLAPS